LVTIGQITLWQQMEWTFRGKGFLQNLLGGTT
jgi:hypothetical protein